MMFNEMVHVYYFSGTQKRMMGRLALKQRKIFFEYDEEFLNSRLELSPFKLPLRPGVIPCEDTVFEGLFGIFNDSQPDGWGRLLLDRKLIKLGVNPGTLSPLDRLCYVGRHGMGALMYEPAIENNIPSYSNDLDEIAEQMFQFQEQDADQFVDQLLALNGSSAGARPKIVVNLVNNSFTPDVIATTEVDSWIIKFRSSMDPADIGAIEYAYHLMAQAAHLNVPEAKLFFSKKGVGYFGVKRFDRKNGHHLHMHTLSGLLHVDHRFPSLDYETIMKATQWLTKDVRECEQQFRAAVFNILAHNRDDHAKNFSFLMDEMGVWHVSPAYDLTFSSGPAGEHCTMIRGEGKSPKREHLLKLAEVGGIKKQIATKIIDETKQAVSCWKTFAGNAGVSKNMTTMIQRALCQIDNNFC